MSLRQLIRSDLWAGLWLVIMPVGMLFQLVGLIVAVSVFPLEASRIILGSRLVEAGSLIILSGIPSAIWAVVS